MIQRALLWAGVALPFVYFANLFGTALAWPGFEHGSTLPSELGTAASPLAGVFNAGLAASGVLGLAGAVGLWLARRSLMAALLGLCLALPALSLIVAAAFPLPSPHHLAFNIVLAGALVPPLAVLTLWRADRRWAVILLGVVLVEVALVALQLAGAASADTVGWFVRALGLVIFGAAAVACWRSLRPA